MSRLQPFVKNPTCPKCGASGRGESGIHRVYHAKGECDFPHECEYQGPTIPGEHHLLHCRVCGYEWRTKVNPRPVPRPVRRKGKGRAR